MTSPAYLKSTGLVLLLLAAVGLSIGLWSVTHLGYPDHGIGIAAAGLAMMWGAALALSLAWMAAGRSLSPVTALVLGLSLVLLPRIAPVTPVFLLLAWPLVFGRLSVAWPKHAQHILLTGTAVYIPLTVLYLFLCPHDQLLFWCTYVRWPLIIENGALLVAYWWIACSNRTPGARNRCVTRLMYAGSLSAMVLATVWLS